MSLRGTVRQTERRRKRFIFVKGKMLKVKGSVRNSICRVYHSLEVRGGDKLRYRVTHEPQG